MKNREIADIFDRMADLMEILGDDHFRINSYRKMARALSDLAEPVENLARDGKLQDLPGIGKSAAEKIQQYLSAGRIDKYEELLAKVPPKLPELLGVPGLGPKTTAKLWKQAGITSVEELRKAIETGDGRLINVEGLGPTKIRNIWQSLNFLTSIGGRIRLGEADALAGPMLAHLAQAKGVQQALAAGSLRRGKETIGDIDILCQAPQSAAEAIIKHFTDSPGVQKVLAGGKTRGSVVLAGAVQADLRVVPAECFGAALSYFTGSKEHNVRLREIAITKGLKFNEYGLFKGDERVAGRNEREIYAALGMQYVPPELRENRGEIEAARSGKLPDLLEAADIRGDMHIHTTASDGLNSIEEMIQACQDRGYQYMAICEHSKSQVQAGGLDEKRLAEHVQAIRKAAKKFPKMLVLAGVEVDIFKDGHLDFMADVLAELDFVVASCHSALAMPADEATARLVKAIETPHVRCIGHPTGRMINSRPGFEIDIDKVASAAAANNVALEVNAHWMRLDLRDIHVRAAVNRGAKIIISTDSHSIDDLDNMKYGVLTARRGWATPADVINSWPKKKLQAWLKEK